MSGFSKEWLTLREDADRRARNRDIAEAVSARFALRDHVHVVDLGCGTGANLRAVAGLLPATQNWLLADFDENLLQEARRKLKGWADSSEDGDDSVVLHKDRLNITVCFAVIDLARDLDRALDGPVDLVTASAFADLVSADFIRRLAQALETKRCCFYAALTCNGVQHWQPHRSLDNQMSSAFHRHQLRDKGFGPAAGPTAAAVLADQFRLSGFTVLEGDSPWILERSDRMLLEELLRGHAMAVAETGLVEPKAIEAWIKVQRTGAQVGHTDTFAVPV